jgi:hypothetical protein
MNKIHIGSIVQLPLKNQYEQFLVTKVEGEFATILYFNPEIGFKEAQVPKDSLIVIK